MNGAQAHIRQRRVLPGRVHPFGLPMNGLQAHIRQRRSRAAGNGAEAGSAT